MLAQDPIQLLQILGAPETNAPPNGFLRLVKFTTRGSFDVWRHASVPRIPKMGHLCASVLPSEAQRVHTVRNVMALEACIPDNTGLPTLFEPLLLDDMIVKMQMQMRGSIKCQEEHKASVWRSWRAPPVHFPWRHLDLGAAVALAKLVVAAHQPRPQHVNLRSRADPHQSAVLRGPKIPTGVQIACGTLHTQTSGNPSDAAVEHPGIQVAVGIAEHPSQSAQLTTQMEDNAFCKLLSKPFQPFSYHKPPTFGCGR